MKVLICKSGNQLISAQAYDETENIKYYLISNAPQIEVREGFIGRYELNDIGQLVVVYEPIPPSPKDEIEKKLSDLEKANADLMLIVAGLIGGGN